MNNNHGTSRPRPPCVFVVVIVVLVTVLVTFLIVVLIAVLVTVLVTVLVLAILSPCPSPLSSSSSTSSSSSANHIGLLCQSSGHIVVRGASPGRNLTGTAPGRIVESGAAPRRIVVIGATSGRTIVRGAAPSRILAGLFCCTRGCARPYRCTPRGAQPCPHRCRAPSGTIVRSALPHLVLAGAGPGAAPHRMLAEVWGGGAEGVAPRRTVAVSPTATASRTIVRGAAPSHVLGGDGRPGVSLLEYPAPLGCIAVEVYPANQRSRFA